MSKEHALGGTLDETTMNVCAAILPLPMIASRESVHSKEGSV